MELIEPQCNLEEEIGIQRFRDLIAFRFKLGRHLISPLLIEMKEMKLIEFKGKCNIRLMWKPEEVTKQLNYTTAR